MAPCFKDRSGIMSFSFLFILTAGMVAAFNP
ncbi:cytochrome C biosynthesis protein, partial [Staphylococcus aureus]